MTAMSRANQPGVSNDGASPHAPARLTAPNDGRNPYMPQKLAGMRTEPPVSEPSAKSTSPAATADADPHEEPPGKRSGARGLSGVPCHTFSPVRP